MRLIRGLLPSLGEGVAVVAIDIDQTESAEVLKRYAEDEGFDWRHVLATRELVTALAEAHGTRVIFPPSDSTIFVDARGEPHLEAGPKDEEALRAFVARYRGP